MPIPLDLFLVLFSINQPVDLGFILRWLVNEHKNVDVVAEDGVDFLLESLNNSMRMALVVNLNHLVDVRVARDCFLAAACCEIASLFDHGVEVPIRRILPIPKYQLHVLLRSHLLPAPIQPVTAALQLQQLDIVGVDFARGRGTGGDSVEGRWILHDYFAFVGGLESASNFPRHASLNLFSLLGRVILGIVFSGHGGKGLEFCVAGDLRVSLALTFIFVPFEHLFF